MTFEENLKRYLSEEEIKALLESFKDSSKHALLLNTNKLSKEDLLIRYPNLKPHPLVENGFIYDKNEYDLGKSIEHELGCFYLQEPSAMIVSSLIDFNENDVVLDYCAAPGGKSIQAALKMNNKGVIISNDLSRQRASLIVDNAERLGISNLLVTSNDFSLIRDYYKNYFTKIILDAPCSGSGMFRKDNKMMVDWSINKVYKFAELQKQLILHAYDMLKPGGVLSYSTCSYSYEEDEEVIKYLLEKTDAELIQLEDNRYFYYSKEKIGVHLLSSHFEGEGHYIAQIKKPGEIKYPNFKNENHFQKYLPEAYKNNQVVNFNGNLFMLPVNIETKKLSIVRYGCKIGEFNKDFIKFDHHFATAVSSWNSEIELNEKEVKDYLAGNPIIKSNLTKGYILLKYQKTPFDLAKSDGRIIKNHYPKGLRKKF